MPDILVSILPAVFYLMFYKNLEGGTASTYILQIDLKFRSGDLAEVTHILAKPGLKLKLL